MTVLTEAGARRARREGPIVAGTLQIGINIYTQARVSRGLAEAQAAPTNPFPIESVPVVR